MKAQQESGFLELPHTADWALKVWAPALPGLLEQSARGMAALMDIRLKPQPRLERSFQLEAPEPEVLLVSFLSELLYINEQEGIAFDGYDLHLEGLKLEARLEGSQLESQSKEIKAVTYHNLEIHQEDGRLTCTLVFDV